MASNLNTAQILAQKKHKDKYEAARTGARNSKDQPVETYTKGERFIRYQESVMNAVAQQQHQAQPAAQSSHRSSPSISHDYSRDTSASASDASLAAPPPPPATAPMPAAPAPAPAPAKGKNKGKKGSVSSANPSDAHAALLSKISQLESTNAEDAHQNAEIEAEVKKANRDLSQLLNTMEPHHSKMDILQKKYSDLLADMKRTEREHVKAKKRGDQLQKEKEEVSKERTRERGLKEKLEKLSRELTRENKKLKDDYRELKENAANRNEELHRKLENLVNDVDEVVSEKRSPERQTAELEQDKLFREKFTSFLHQYELRELHFQSLLRVKELEVQYQIARHDQLKKAQESELSKSHQLTRQVSTFSQTENELRGQLNVYVEKFKQVEDTLNNSNDLFLTFRKEMEEMSKKTKRLEKENLNLTRKQEATNKNIFQMAEERSQSQQAIDRLTRENEKLKKLCRAMQTGGYGNAQQMAQQGHAGQGADEFDEGLEGETESEYEDDEEYDEDEGEYDDDTEEEPMDEHTRVYGPPPPPPPQTEVIKPNGQIHRVTEAEQRAMGQLGHVAQQAVQVNGNGQRH
ncbi:Putative Taxilin family [Septoria linicola]|uniref:Taxilin family n=1 Tax=Septoria linicola TaxID=215465 RepID=A0A9Q9AYK8_9PEZI|nr:putative Taxilin family [Septoria linicola]USW57519.1 Putative Taxilin family [Septoria linicola]